MLSRFKWEAETRNQLYYKQCGEVFEVSIAVPEEKRLAFAIALEQLLDTVAEVLPVEVDAAESTEQ